MIYSIVFGGDARGWVHLAFTREEPKKPAFLLGSFQGDVANACIKVAKEGCNDKLTEPGSSEWIWYPVFVDAFVRTMEAAGYRLADSVALVSPGPGNILTLSCNVPKDWDHSLGKR